ncbi:MAG TPA: hypothetical protein ENJ66_03960 [Calditrichae bacterium]|nr:hypothetical protein [Calditrichia bacterium]
MKRLIDVRRAYAENYNKMQEIIRQMGGDSQIKYHRQRNTRLYRKLKELQRREHYLDQLECRLRKQQLVLH